MADAGEQDEWITASEAFQLLKPALGTWGARNRICARAHAGLIRARADHFAFDKKQQDDVDILKGFWWAEGHEALQQDWEAGDFSTWIDHKYHLRAFGVRFNRADIMKLLPPSPAPAAPAAAGGRPKADWWDDLWVEICRQLYEGDLKPDSQAAIESAMLDWLSAQGHSAAESTIRLRARKLWTAIGKGKN